MAASVQLVNKKQKFSSTLHITFKQSWQVAFSTKFY